MSCAGCSEDAEETAADASVDDDALGDSSSTGDSPSEVLVDATLDGSDGDPADTAPDGSVGDANDAAKLDGDATLDAQTDGTDTAASDAFDAASDASGGDAADGNDATSDVADGGDDTADVADMADANPLSGREVWVSRVGDGIATLDGLTRPVEIQRYALDTGALLGSITLPTASAGPQAALTLRGSAFAEGTLTRSVDGRFVTLGGYAAPPGTADTATFQADAAAVVTRVVARIGADRAVDTTTTGLFFPSGEFRSVVSKDGTSYWLAGHGGSSYNGVAYVGSHGGTPTPVYVATGLAHARHATFVGDAIWGSSGISAMRLFELPGAAPTAAVTATALPGNPGSGGSPYGVAPLAVAGSAIDTLFVCDDRPYPDGGGVHRLANASTGWWSTTRWSVGAESCKALTAFIVGPTIYVVAVLRGSPVAEEQRLVVFEDTLAGLASPAPRTLATVGTNYAWRGVALAPHP